VFGITLPDNVVAVVPVTCTGKSVANCVTVTDSSRRLGLYRDGAFGARAPRP
jgi:hypothetical protein